MSQKTIARVERLQQLNSNRQWIDHDLYRLMYQEDLYIIAYERIKSKPGNMTPGRDEETLDGFSLAAIREIIQEMRTEHFCFRPVREQFIPKPNGKMRKLGIPCVWDKVVQEVMPMILEAIYDSPDAPYFQETSHGFRPQRSCHTALREIHTHWTGVNWYKLVLCYPSLSTFFCAIVVSVGEPAWKRSPTASEGNDAQTVTTNTSVVTTQPAL